jgi:electron transfer flavoprotein-quinone oxidoreductase
MADDFDIIVVGAGIAGTACALRCARAGLSVLLLERGEHPGSKNLSGGRLYCRTLSELLPNYLQTAPLERRITQENLTLLAREGATTWSSLQPGGDSWSLLRARFDPWFVAQAEAEGVQCLTGVTVTSLVKKSGRICGVIADDETLSARFVVLAEGANSELAQRHALVEPPATTAMALGIKEVLALDKSILEERFRLEEHEGAAMLFCGGICGSLPGGAFLYTNQTTLSLGIVCPLSTLTRGDTAANELLPQLKRHPALHPLLRESETLEYGAHLIPEGGLHGLPPRYAGEGWLLVGDALGTCVNTGFTVRGMDMALLGAQAAANTLIAACRTSGPQNLSHAYEQEIKHSRLWEVLQRYQSVPALLQRPGWYHHWPALMQEIACELWQPGAHPPPPLRQLVWRHFRRHGLRHLAGDVIRSIRCL